MKYLTVLMVGDGSRRKRGLRNEHWIQPGGGDACLHITCQLYSGSQAESLALRTLPFSLAGHTFSLFHSVLGSCAQDSLTLSTLGRDPWQTLSWDFPLESLGHLLGCELLCFHVLVTFLSFMEELALLLPAGGMATILKFNMREKQHPLKPQRQGPISPVGQPNSQQSLWETSWQLRQGKLGQKGDVSTSSATYWLCDLKSH